MSQLTVNEKISACSNRRCELHLAERLWRCVTGKPTVKCGFSVIVVISAGSLELLAPLQQLRQFDNDAKWIIFINGAHTAVHDYTDVMSWELFFPLLLRQMHESPSSVEVKCDEYVTFHSLMTMKGMKGTKWRPTGTRQISLRVVLCSPPGLQQLVEETGVSARSPAHFTAEWLVAKWQI